MSPVEAIFGLFSMAFDAVFGWFVRMLTASGAVGVYLAVFTVYCVSRFLILPLIGNTDGSQVGDD